MQIQLKSLAEEMQAIIKGLEKVEQELAASENDGPVSEVFRKVSPAPPTCNFGNSDYRHHSKGFAIFWQPIGIKAWNPIVLQFETSQIQGGLSKIGWRSLSLYVTFRFQTLTFHFVLMVSLEN